MVKYQVISLWRCHQGEKECERKVHAQVTYHDPPSADVAMRVVKELLRDGAVSITVNVLDM